MGEWISVYERLPEFGEDVLLYRPDARKTWDPIFTVRVRQPNGLGPFKFDCVAVPTHWMPLTVPA